MPEDTKEPSDFKVVDRRPFAADGTRREGPHEAERSPEIRLVPDSASSPPKDARAGYDIPGPSPASRKISEAEPLEDEPEGDSGFNTLVSYLYTTAMFQLGLMQGPGGERIPPDLPNARRTVDLLEVLQQKTRGNLTPAESKLLDDVLYDLRVTFVDVQEQMAAKKR